MTPNLNVDYLVLARAVLRSLHRSIWSSYDAAADVLHVNFTRPADAAASKLTDEDVVLRYRGEELIGFTVLNASARIASGATPRERPAA